MRMKYSRNLPNDFNEEGRINDKTKENHQELFRSTQDQTLLERRQEHQRCSADDNNI